MLTLHLIGYPLAKTQADLTPLQRAFLLDAISEYTKAQGGGTDKRLPVDSKNQESAELRRKLDDRLKGRPDQ